MSIHMSDELDALPLNRKNPGPFVICAVLVDVSSSININNEEPIRELNKGYSEFREFICNDDVGGGAIIGTFGIGTVTRDAGCFGKPRRTSFATFRCAVDRKSVV